MPLLNYTTEVPAIRTLNEIQNILARAGARAVMLNFDEKGDVSSIAFRISTPFGMTAYSLPCDKQACLLVLRNQSTQGKVPARLVNPEQAARVGWRIIKDWIEAQLALVQTEMVTLDQVFLPYAVTGNGKTVYERYIETGLAGLALEGPKSP